MIKEAVNVPVMVAGRVDNPDLALDALENGSADMIGLGRPLLADPYIPEKIRRNQADRIRPCLSCHDGCLGRLKEGLPISCAVNPTAAREEAFNIKKADTIKNILVIGGGVAGMEAARVCKLRGHNVTLFEKTSQLGGSLVPGGMPDFKRYDHKLIKWYEGELKNLNIDIRMNEAATPEIIEDKKWDSVIVATGAKPMELNLKGKEKNKVYNGVEVSLDPEKAGEKIVIIGAGLVGAEIGLWMSQKGKDVTIVELTNKILGGDHAMCFANYDMLKDLLNFHKVKIMTETCAEEVTEEGIIVKTKDGNQLLKADTIITAVGYRSENSLYDEVKMLDKEVYILGDAKNVHNIMYAIWDSYDVARFI
jgi:2-enoate reductase